MKTSKIRAICKLRACIKMRRSDLKRIDLKRTKKERIIIRLRRQI